MWGGSSSLTGALNPSWEKFKSRTIAVVLVMKVESRNEFVLIYVLTRAVVEDSCDMRAPGKSTKVSTLVGRALPSSLKCRVDEKRRKAFFKVSVNSV